MSKPADEAVPRTGEPAATNGLNGESGAAQDTSHETAQSDAGAAINKKKKHRGGKKKKKGK